MVEKLSDRLAKRKDVKDPEALAAYILRKKYGARDPSVKPEPVRARPE